MPKYKKFKEEAALSKIGPKAGIEGITVAYQGDYKPRGGHRWRHSFQLN